MRILKSVLAVSCIAFLACGEDNPSSTQGNVAASNNTDQSEQEILSSDAMEMSSSNESAVVLSSSSLAVKESSSSFVVPGCKTETEDDCVYGTIIDSRDGKTYKTVVIGDQEWMAENLYYDYPVYVGDSVSSTCKLSSPIFCNPIGIYYGWAKVIGANKEDNCNENECELPEGDIQGLCPDGWHLPSVNEYRTLLYAVGGSCDAVRYTSHNRPIEDWYQISNKLKADSGWSNAGLMPDGDNRYGFSALPSGRVSRSGDNENTSYAIFLTSTQFDDKYIYTVWLYGGGSTGAIHADYPKSSSYMVRCVKNTVL